MCCATNLSQRLLLIRSISGRYQVPYILYQTWRCISVQPANSNTSSGFKLRGETYQWVHHAIEKLTFGKCLVKVLGSMIGIKLYINHFTTPSYDATCSLMRELWRSFEIRIPILSKSDLFDASIGETGILRPTFRIDVPRRSTIPSPSVPLCIVPSQIVPS